MKNEIKNHFRLSPPHLAFLAWGDFHTHLPFAPSTIPEGKWGLFVVQSVVILKKRLKRSGIWQMSFVTQLSKMINVKSWNNIVPSPGGSSDKILYFLFSPVSFLISTDPVMSKFVPVIPTVVINIFPIDVYYSQDLLKTQIFVVGCWLLYNSDEYFSCRAPNQRAPNCPTWDQERFIAVIKE